MRKKVWIPSTLILICLIAFIIFGWGYVPGIVANQISKMVKVRVSISYISLFPKTISIYGFVMGNPKGYKLSKSLKIGKASSKAFLTAYFKDNIVVDEVVLSDVYLGLEMEAPFNTNSNWTVILNNMSNGSKDSSNKKTLIKHLLIEDLQVDLIFRQGDQRPRKIKPIKKMEFFNVSSEGGVPANQLTNIIIREMMKEVLQNQLKSLMQEALSPNNALSPLKGLFSDREDILEGKETFPSLENMKNAL